MKLRRCTAFLEDGSRHDVEGDCTRVVIRAGGNVIRHWVCPDCRGRMNLPDEDVDLSEVASSGRKGADAGRAIRDTL